MGNVANIKFFKNGLIGHKKLPFRSVLFAGSDQYLVSTCLHLRTKSWQRFYFFCIGAPVDYFIWRKWSNCTDALEWPDLSTHKFWDRSDLISNSFCSHGNIYLTNPSVQLNDMVQLSLFLYLKKRKIIVGFPMSMKGFWRFILAI